MACWHVGPCGVGCDGYVANPPPGQAPVIIVPPSAPLMAFEVREMVERLQRDIIELQRQKAAQYEELHERLSRADRAYYDLRRALDKYGAHREGCVQMTGKPCSCGFDKVRS